MRTLLLLLTCLSFISCRTSSRIYDSDYNKVNRDIIYNHLFGGSKTIPETKLIKETLDSSSYKLEFGQAVDCSGWVIVKPFRPHELKVTVNFGCVNLKHTAHTRTEFLDELGGLLH